MEKFSNKDIISDRSDNLGSKTNLSKNSPLNGTQQLLLSSDIGKKTNDRKTNDIKQFNFETEKSINKKIRKEIDDDSFSYDNYKLKDSRKIKKDKKVKKVVNKIIVDDIDNIYSYLSNKSNKVFLIQKIILLTIACFVSICHWIFLFLFNPKQERDYCFTKLNQFDSCSTQEICNNYNNKISIILYNNSLNIHNNSLTYHQNFLEEFKSVNEYYRPFFVNHNYEISKRRLFYSLDLFNYNANKLNVAIILTKKENWNIFLKFFSLCQRESFYFYSSAIVIISGIIGSFISGVLADIFGRKKIIIFNLFIVALSFTFLTILTLMIESKYQYFFNEYKNKYNVTSIEGNDAILSILYSQQKISKYFESNAIKYFISLFLLNLTLRALGKTSLALLLEDSTSELKVLENFRRYTFYTTGLPPFATFLILLVINDITITIIFMNSIVIILFILSFCLLNESIRFKYEHCEWKELTEIIENLFKIDNESPIIYKNKIEFEAFKLKETQIMLNKMYVNLNFNRNFTNSTIFNYIKQRNISLNRDIRRNYEVIIKNQEMKINPFIIFTCISANRVFLKVKYLFIILLLIIYSQVHFLEKEILNIPFFQVHDLYIDIKNNYLLNSNYFILCLVTYASNWIFLSFYRINCFKIILFIALFLVTSNFILYHFLSYEYNEYPLDLNETNFSNLELYYKFNRKYKIYIIIFIIYFLLNGINFYINILVLKLSKTIYRCSLFGFNTGLALLSFAFGECLDYQIENYFFLLGSLNLIGILAIFYFGELKTIPYIINDLKQNINKEKNKLN